MKTSETVPVPAALTSWDPLHPQGHEITPGGQLLGHHNPLNHRLDKTQEHLSRIEVKVGRKLLLVDACDFFQGLGKEEGFSQNKQFKTSDIPS